MTDVSNVPVLEAAPVLEATPVLEAAPAVPAEELLDMTFSVPYKVGDDEFEVTGNLQDLPAKTRVALLKTAIRSYCHNRVSTDAAKVKKANEHWTLHDADPINVSRPEKERLVHDQKAVIEASIKALREGNMGKKGTGEAKPKKSADPLETMITRAVVAALWAKRKDLPGAKYPLVQKEVGNNGRAYIETQITARVAAGENEKDVRKSYTERFIRPAEIQLGINLPKSLVDAGDLL